MKFLLILTLLSTLLFAAPAFHGKRTFTQADGTIVEYRQNGDEYLHWQETDNGDILLFSKKSKQLEYAMIKNGSLKPSGIIFSKKKKSKKSSPHMKISNKELKELYLKKRQTKLSKMKKAPKPANK